MRFNRIAALLSLSILVVDVALGKDAKEINRKLKSKRSKRHIPKMHIKDLSWITGTWFICYKGATLKIKTPGPVIQQLPNDEWPPNSSMVIESSVKNDGSFAGSIQKFNVKYYEMMPCNIIGLGADDCTGATQIEILFQGMGSLSTALQDRLVLQSTMGNYLNEEGKFVPWKTDSFVTLTCDVSKDMDGFLFCDTTGTLNNEGPVGFKTHFMNSQFLVRDQADCKYAPEV